MLLGLVNLNYALEKKGENLYYNEFDNILVVFRPCYIGCTVANICNATVPKDVYNYLINILNTKKNLVVEWSQIEGTTSDYNIYYGLNAEKLIAKGYDGIIKELESIGNIVDKLRYKYNEIIDGEVKPIK